MKTKLIWVLLFVSILTLVGCGTKEKLEKKTSEALAEKVIGDAINGKIDIDGDKVTIKGEDGQEVTFGSTEWPSTDLVKNIPKFEDGTIASVMDLKDSVWINIEQVKKENFEKYLNKIKNEYTEEAYEINADGNLTYSAGNNDGIVVQVYYVDEVLTITVTQMQKEE